MLKRLASLLLTVLLLSALLCAPAQATSTGYDPEHPEVLSDVDLDADAAILIEVNTGMVVYEKNADARMFPASTTKILTVYLGILLGNLNQTVTTSATALQIDADSSVIPLAQGEQLNFEDLLYATMVKSGNDGANVIAESVAGSIDAFVALMNQYVESLGCVNTHFTNPNGLHNDAHYASVRDMATIAREAMQDDTFRKIASTTTYVLPKDNVYRERTLNSRMLEFFGDPEAKNYYPYANGIKTGNTTNAGHCFVGSAEKDGVWFISVVFRCSSYTACWRDTKKLMEYGFSQYVSTTVPQLYAMNPKVLEISSYDLNDPGRGQLELTLTKMDGTQDDTIVTLRSRLEYLSANFNDLVNIEYVHDPVAPIQAGEVMALLTYYPDAGEPIEYQLLASRTIGRRALDYPTLDEIISDSVNDENPFPRFSVEILMFFVAVIAVIVLLFVGIKRLLGFRSKRPRRKPIKPISRYYR
ncbi:MAG: D-alanyl-D-alanine carboxypeptidase [Clostridia bacterium]|nr:D-alanyl-D-alanine carboxypeptidase [Clostridia bacterium]